MRILCLLAALSVSANAQPSTVDVEFVEAFLGSGSVAGGVEVTPGEAPAGFAALLPDGAEVLGSFWVADPSGGRFGVIVARTGAEAATAEATLRERATPGWGPAAGPEAPEPQGGFVSSGSPASPIRLRQTGGSTRVATLGVQPRPEGGSFLVIEIREGGAPDAGAPSFETLAPHVPLLAAPPGATQHGSSSSGSHDEYQTRGTVETALAPAALLAHYGGQLVEEGWTHRAGGASADAAVSTWTRSAGGRRLVATLDAVRASRETYDLRFSVVARDP